MASGRADTFRNERLWLKPIADCDKDYAYALTNWLHDSGRPRDAVPYMEFVMALLERDNTSFNPSACKFYILFAKVFMKIDKWDYAEELVTRACSVYASSEKTQKNVKKGKETAAMVKECAILLEKVLSGQHEAQRRKERAEASMFPNLHDDNEEANRLSGNQFALGDVKHVSEWLYVDLDKVQLKKQVTIKNIIRTDLQPSTEVTHIFFVCKLRLDLLPAFINVLTEYNVRLQMGAVYVKREGANSADNSQATQHAALTAMKSESMWSGQVDTTDPQRAQLAWYVCTWYAIYDYTRGALSDFRIKELKGVLMGLLDFNPADDKPYNTLNPKNMEFVLGGFSPLPLKGIMGKTSVHEGDPRLGRRKQKMQQRRNSMSNVKELQGRIKGFGVRANCRVLNRGIAPLLCTEVNLSVGGERATLMQDIFWLLRERGLVIEHMTFMLNHHQIMEMAIQVYDSLHGKEVSPSQLVVLQHCVTFAADGAFRGNPEVMHQVLPRQLDTSLHGKAMGSHAPREYPRGVMRRTVKAALKAAVPEFMELPSEMDRWRVVDMMTLQHFPAGTQLLRQDSQATHFGVVQDGMVEVVRDGIVEQEGGSEFAFGGLALSNTTENHHTVNCLTHVSAFMISWREFWFLFEAMGVPQRNKYRKVMSRAIAFQNLKPEQIQALSDVVWQDSAVAEAPKGRAVLRVGDKLRAAVLVIEGQLTVKTAHLERPIGACQTFGLQALKIEKDEEGIPVSSILAGENIEAEVATVMVGFTAELLSRADISLDLLDFEGDFPVSTITQTREEDEEQQRRDEMSIFDRAKEIEIRSPRTSQSAAQGGGMDDRSNTTGAGGGGGGGSGGEAAESEDHHDANTKPKRGAARARRSSGMGLHFHARRKSMMGPGTAGEANTTTEVWADGALQDERDGGGDADETEGGRRAADALSSPKAEHLSSDLVPGSPGAPASTSRGSPLASTGRFGEFDTSSVLHEDPLNIQEQAESPHQTEEMPEIVEYIDPLRHISPRHEVENIRLLLSGAGLAWTRYREQNVLRVLRKKEASHIPKFHALTLARQKRKPVNVFLPSSPSRAVSKSPLKELQRSLELPKLRTPSKEETANTEETSTAHLPYFDIRSAPTSIPPLRSKTSMGFTRNTDKVARVICAKVRQEEGWGQAWDYDGGLIKPYGMLQKKTECISGSLVVPYSNAIGIPDFSPGTSLMLRRNQVFDLSPNPSYPEMDSWRQRS